METNEKIFFSLDLIARWSCAVGRFGGSLCLGFMTLLITIDVIGRFLFGVPTFIASEISGYLVVVITFLGLAHVSRVGRQIEVSVLVDRFPMVVREWMKFATLTASVTFIGWFAYITSFPVIQNFELKATSITFLHTPMWIPTGFVPLGLTMLFFELLSQWCVKVKAIVHRGKAF